MHDDHDDLSREREIDKWMEQEPGPRERQPIPVMRDSSRDLSPIEKLLALFDAALVIESFVGVHESVVPGAENALRLWAATHRKPIREMTYADSTQPMLRTVHCDVDGPNCSICVYTKVAS